MNRGFTITMIALLGLLLTGAAISSVAMVSLFQIENLYNIELSEEGEGDEDDGEAQESLTEEQEQEITELDFKCSAIMHAEGENMIARYSTFLDEYFNLDIDTSEQIANAQLYQRYVQTNLSQLYDEKIDLPDDAVLQEAITENLECARWRDWYITESSILLQNYALRSTSSKETFQVVDALKELNTAMEDLSLEFQMTFPLSFKKMDNALPCYARQCI